MQYGRPSRLKGYRPRETDDEKQTRLFIAMLFGMSPYDRLDVFAHIETRFCLRCGRFRTRGLGMECRYCSKSNDKDEHTDD